LGKSYMLKDYVKIRSVRSVTARKGGGKGALFQDRRNDRGWVVLGGYRTWGR